LVAATVPTSDARRDAFNAAWCVHDFSQIARARSARLRIYPVRLVPPRKRNGMNSHRFSGRAGARRQARRRTAHLHLEPLEDRRVPTASIGLLKDIVPGNVGSVGTRSFNRPMLVQGDVA